MEPKLNLAVLKELRGRRPSEMRRVLVVEVDQKGRITYDEVRAEHVGNKEDFTLDKIGSHVQPTLIFRRARNGRLYPVKKKGS